MKTNIPASFVHRRRGFTLIEVLVSSAITALLLLMLFNVLIGTMNAWEGGTARLQTNGDARFALDLIARDLQSMVVRQTPHNQQWLASYPVEVTQAGNSSQQWPSKPSEPNTTSLTFFAPSLDRDAGQEGDIVAVSYRAGLQDPLSKQEFAPIFGLYKTMIRTDDTFNLALGQSDVVSNFWFKKTGTADDPLSRVGFLIPNAVEFKVSWWIRNNATNVLARVPPTTGLFLGNSLRLNTPISDPVDAKIEAADISLTLLTDEGMRLYRLLAKTEENYKRVLREHGRVHTQRVVIQY